MSNPGRPDAETLEKLQKCANNKRARFILELEFVQLLANPQYLRYLAQNRYFEDERFINFLSYLQYWSKPQYIKYISYPHCLYFLELLQREEFRNALLQDQYIGLVHHQQFQHWRYFRRNRIREKTLREEEEDEGVVQGETIEGSEPSGSAKMETEAA